MTRKDYEIVAREVKQALIDVKENGVTGEQAIAGLIDGLSDRFIEDNPRFDRVRFIEACGYNLSAAK